MWPASFNVSGWGTSEHRKVPDRPSCGDRVSGEINRNGNSSTHSKAREGFPVTVGALTDSAAFSMAFGTGESVREGVQATARTNESNREKGVGQVLGEAMNGCLTDSVSWCFCVRPTEMTAASAAGKRLFGSRGPRESTHWCVDCHARYIPGWKIP